MMTAGAHHPLTRLSPDQAFPAELTVLSTARLLILDSLIRRQLDHEMPCELDGAHPLTLERHFDLVTELDAREITAATVDHNPPGRPARGYEGYRTTLPVQG
jgi:hypothetical protein